MDEASAPLLLFDVGALVNVAMQTRPENKQAPRSAPRRRSGQMLIATRASACPTSIVLANNSHVRPLIQIRSVSGERPPRVSGSGSLSRARNHVQAASSE